MVLVSNPAYNRTERSVLPINLYFCSRPNCTFPGSECTHAPQLLIAPPLQWWQYSQTKDRHCRLASAGGTGSFGGWHRLLRWVAPLASVGGTGCQPRWQAPAVAAEGRNGRCSLHWFIASSALCCITASLQPSVNSGRRHYSWHRDVGSDVFMLQAAGAEWIGCYNSFGFCTDIRNSA